MQYFYTDLLPVSLLIAASMRDPRDLAILAAHLLLFPRGAAQVIRRLSAATVGNPVPLQQ